MSQADNADRSGEIERLQAELNRLRGELARTREVQSSLWSHEIYLNARKKLTVGLFAVLGVLSALGLFTVYDMYVKLESRLQDYAEGSVRQSINVTVKTRTDAILEEAEKTVSLRLQDFEASAETKLGVLLKSSEDKVTALIDDLAR